MKSWHERTKEEAYLLNPAFCCMALTYAIVNYIGEKEDGMPFPLAFMILPIALHKKSRDSLPYNTRTSLPAWIQDNTSARNGFPERVVSVKPYTREAMLFGSKYNWLIFKEGGKLHTSKSKSDFKSYIIEPHNEAAACIKQAGFIGRWFAKAGSAHTVMSLWGIRP
jgi:hypothetical protein